MCDQARLRTQPMLGNIEHVNYLSENIGALFMRDDYSDVTLLVEETRFPAHKVILAARSEYFRALFYGGLRESRPDCGEIEMKDTSATAFQHLLKYIYTSKMNLSDLQEEALLDVLGLAHQYGFQELESAISTYLRDTLNVRNVCLIYDIASMYSLEILSTTCCEFMDRNATDIIQSEAFFSLSSGALQAILSRDSFCASEIEIFQSVRKWAEHNPEENLATVMRVVRLPLIKLEDLLNTVRPSSMVSADIILDAIKLKNECRDMDLKYRGFLLMEENIATLRHQAQVIRGEMKSALLDGDFTTYDLDKGFTRHPIDENVGQGIVIQLDQPSILNAFRMLLWDRDMRSYSYYIEVSMDDTDWVRVVDHTRYLCRSWQFVRFPARVVKFIRIVGTHNTVNRVFHLVHFECFYSKDPFELENGIIVPKENVATIEASACVIEGVSRSRNALINGDTKNYDWDSGYTCHQLGSGAIVVQLAQPYIIGSMRLLLWDCDGRSYSYCVEVSTDQHNWQLVSDRTTEACRSWQVIVFDKRPVTFVKIVGTHNTANEVFHCVHFECPADPNALTEHNEPRHKQPQHVVTSAVVSSSGVMVGAMAAPPSYANSNIPTHPVIAMARVNPMPSSSAIDIGLRGPVIPGRSLQMLNVNLPHSVPNRPDILEAESDDSIEAGPHLGPLGAVGGEGSPAVIERENPQGLRIVWVDRGDGLGENQEVPVVEDSPREQMPESPQGAVGGYEPSVGSQRADNPLHMGARLNPRNQDFTDMDPNPRPGRSNNNPGPKDDSCDNNGNRPPGPDS